MVENSVSEYFIRLLQGYGVNTVFGIVGIPIVELADTMISKGIRFIGCRNEQAASYAASAYGYLTGKPGVLLVVGGPGLIHALAGVYNSMNNRWPLLVIAGSSEDQHKGGFQELDQISLLSGYLKFTGRIQRDQETIDLIAYNAMRYAQLGTKGVTYIDFPGNLINDVLPNFSETEIQPLCDVKCMPDPASVDKVANLILRNQRKKVLVVLGKGAVDSAPEIRSFVDCFNLPFLPTPMAKGIVPDSHPLNVSSGRSQALREAEIVIVVGARLNWILHFAKPPKWNSDAIFIQVDSNAETIGQNNAKGMKYGLYGDIGLSLQSLSMSLKALGSFTYSGLSNELKGTIRQNHQKLFLKESSPLKNGLLNYNQVYARLRPLMDDSRTFIVAEGANTMDTARVSFPTDYPRRRLDAGTNATMGVGIGYGIAAKIAQPSKDVVIIQGDSAFGFSAMELETAVRHELGLIVVVMNNSGIYHGVDKRVHSNLTPSTALTFECRYDLVGKGLGAHGHLVRSLQELEHSFQEAVVASRLKGQTTVINVIIEPGKQSKLSFGWQTKRQQRL